jgi:hypothetical protein
MVVSAYMSVATNEIQKGPSSYRDGYSQQYIEGLAGIDRRILCAPTAFYKLAEKTGYDIPLPDYVDMIREELDSSSGDEGWNRARLSKTLREEWGVSSVSCWTKSLGKPVSDEGLMKMQAAGYLSDSPLEVDLLKQVMGSVSEGPKGVIDLLRLGIPVVTTVEPGFATNKAKHAIVLEDYNDAAGTVTVFDPDERNAESSYPVDWVEHHLSPDGGTTIMLPPADSDSRGVDLAA